MKNKAKDKEIKIALKDLAGKTNCQLCVVHETCPSGICTFREALDLINRLEAENRSLISEVNLYRQEVERLQIEQTIAKFEKNKDFTNIKVETVKEFVERSIDRAYFDGDYFSVKIEDINNLAKEMEKKYDNRSDN